MAGVLFLAAPVAAVLAAGLSLGPGDRLLVVAPHPDDETLGAGGLIQAARQAHVPVQVVVVTNGDGSTPAAAKLTKALFVTAIDRIKLGHVRQAETLAAMAALGVGREAVHFLGYPDKLLSLLWEDHWKTPYYSPALRSERDVYQNVHTPRAPFAGASVCEDLSGLLRTFRPTVVVLPSALDLHPDHRATALFAQQALFDNPTLHPRVYAYLVHRGAWPSAGPYLTVPENTWAAHQEWLSFALEPGWEARKAEAIKLYQSQMAVSPTYLLGFAKRNELFAEVKTARLNGLETTVASESEARAGLRDVAVDHEQLLSVKNPGVWSIRARVEGGVLQVRLTAVAPQLVPSQYTFLVRDGGCFSKVITDQPRATIPVKGRAFFLSAQFSDARRHVLTLPWVACEAEPEEILAAVRDSGFQRPAQSERNAPAARAGSSPLTLPSASTR
ncbi:MAG TPA: PIG-L family deacetylase [Firmicutes bacterium]|nr:PIG-L family deacetylase [Bacillota bacterium]